VVEVLKLLTQQQQAAQLAMQQQLQQTLQQQQLAMQQALLQQQQTSQQATMEMFASLIKELKQPAMSSTHTSSTVVHGPAGPTQNNAVLPSPSSTPTDNPSATHTAPTAQSSRDGDEVSGRNAESGHDDEFGGEEYPEDGDRGWNHFHRETSRSHASSWMPPVRGGFSTGRGRGGTPSQPSRPSPQPQTSQFKLPEPEPFRGDIQDWPRFWEEWTHYVSQTMPDDISKCRLIKKLLQGPVKELTQCYRDTAADYKNLAEALKERYDQPDILLSYLQRKLRDMRIPDRETAASLRTFYTQIQALCRQLTDAGRNTDDPMITDTIYSKLPAKMKAKVAEQRLASPADGWSTQKLLDLMKAHVRLAEHISLSNDAQYPVVEKKDVPQHRNVHAIQASSTSPEDDYVDAHSHVGDQEDSHDATSVSSGLAPSSHPMPAVGSA
ncbi:gag protein, partial [Aphelenchoides avenae]